MYSKSAVPSRMRRYSPETPKRRISVWRGLPPRLGRLPPHATGASVAAGGPGSYSSCECLNRSGLGLGIGLGAGLGLGLANPN